MTIQSRNSMWATAGVLAARLIFGAVFLMTATFKFTDLQGTAGYIASIGFPFPLVLAWVAALVEITLALAFLTGAFFTEAATLGAAYVLFLALAFHGPSHWQANPTEFGFFTDHFTFIAGLLFAAVHGPGRRLVLDRRTLRNAPGNRRGNVSPEKLT